MGTGWADCDVGTSTSDKKFLVLALFKISHDELKIMNNKENKTLYSSYLCIHIVEPARYLMRPARLYHSLH